MKPRWILCLCLIFSQVAQATVTTTVDQDEVAPGQSIVVTYDADQHVGQPDFTPLQKDFDVVDQNQSSSISIVNGRTSYDLKWKVVLMPKGTGKLTIPPVHFGSALSEARTVTVLTGSEQAGGKGDVLVDYQVDDPTPR
ncbi:MAG: BatD family protein, partial [Arenicellales bacterium]